MKDIITYIPDLIAFRAEAAQLSNDGDPLFTIDGAGGIFYNVAKVPVHYNGNESICLVKTSESDLERITTIERLGECVNGEYVFDSQDAQETYERVRGSLEFTYTDGSGQEQTGYKPYMIGVFA